MDEDVRACSMIRLEFVSRGEIRPNNFQSDSGCRRQAMSDDGVWKSLQIFQLLESLILAQDERWRRA